ncbi:MAG: MFS transporter [Planctomycetes bacterium]|nr:MFS transporter [Planctomycetota bacterium]
MTSGNPNVGAVVPPSRPLPRPVWILSWVSFFADISSEMMYPILPLFLVGSLGASETQLGAMEGGAVLLVSLMSATAGFRSDRPGRLGGRVRWLHWGYGLPVFGKGIIAFATFWPLVFVGRMLDRFGKGLRGAPRDALIVDAVSVEQRGRAFGLHRAFDTAGALVGVLASAFLLWFLTGTPDTKLGVVDIGHVVSETPGWVYRAIFGVSAVLGLLSWALTFFVREAVSENSMDARDSKSATTEEQRGVGGVDKRRPRWMLPRAYWAVIAMLVLFSLANSSDTFLLLRVRELGFSSWAVVLAYAAFNVTYAAISYPIGALSDRIGRWKLIASGWGIYSVVYALFAVLPAEQSWGVWPLMATYGVYMALTDGVGKALIADFSPNDARGTALGLFYGLTGITTFLASLLAGVLWQLYGSKWALLMGTLFATLALIAMAIASRFSASS